MSSVMEYNDWLESPVDDWLAPGTHLHHANPFNTSLGSFLDDPQAMIPDPLPLHQQEWYDPLAYSLLTDDLLLDQTPLGNPEWLEQSSNMQQIQKPPVQKCSLPLPSPVPELTFQHIPELPSSPETFSELGLYFSPQATDPKTTSDHPANIQNFVPISETVVEKPVQPANPIEKSAMQEMFMDVDNEVPMECGDNLLQELEYSAVIDFIVEQMKLANIGPFFPPVTPDDVDSLLLSDSQPPPSEEEDTSFAQMAPSPASSSTLSASSIDLCSAASPAASIPSVASSPCVEKVHRKKEQNKTAAQRYRQKKRSEQGSVTSEYEILQRRNIELKTKVDEMTKEVDYLKALMAEIFA